MFGYIRPLAAELKVREYEFYRSVYCGLCRALGRHTGCASRLALNYDMIFLALVRMAVHPEDFKLRLRRCPVHPLKRRGSIEECRALAFCAYATAQLTADKLADNADDDRGLRRAGAVLLLPYGRLLRRRAARFPGLEGCCAPSLADLRRLEEEHCPSVDRPADAFGGALAALCAGDTGAADEPLSRICRDIGLHLGRFIYIADAADDLADDIKHNNYNPIAASYGVTEPDDALRASLYDALLLECRALYDAVSLLDFSGCRDAGAILANITQLGMPAAAARILGIRQTGEVPT